MDVSGFIYLFTLFYVVNQKKKTTFSSFSSSNTEGFSSFLLLKTVNWFLFFCRGKCQISSFLRKTQQKFEREVENLKLVEDTLDSLIKSCAQQLFDMTDDTENAEYPSTAEELLLTDDLQSSVYHS